MHDCHFHQLLDRFERSRTGYHKVRKGVKKRISRHMQQLGCQTINAYLAVLESNIEARRQCECLLTVSISRFFRDQKLWQKLEQDILPRLTETEKIKINLWSAGCACGEEVYSIKIVWERLKKSRNVLPELYITASDINPVYIEKAQAGNYSGGSLKEVPDTFLSIYFDPIKGTRHFAIKSFLKDNIKWKTQDLFSDVPGNDFHIIFLRNNLLTYYQDRLKKIALSNILKCLAPHGFLVIGSHEALPYNVPALVAFDSYKKDVFRKFAAAGAPL
ncbi:CheR family methyltransferase [Thermodesulfobacteriota bacterium]